MTYPVRCCDRFSSTNLVVKPVEMVYRNKSVEAIVGIENIERLYNEIVQYKCIFLMNIRQYKIDVMAQIYINLELIIRKKWSIQVMFKLLEDILLRDNILLHHLNNFMNY